MKAITEDRKQNLIAALERVKTAALNGEYSDMVKHIQENPDHVQENPDHAQFGICGMWAKASLDGEPIYTLVLELAPSWPLFSGAALYPIGKGKVDYYTHKPKLVGEALELRLSLIDHILAKLKSHTAEEVFSFQWKEGK